MRVEIRGRADDRRALIRRHSYGDHVALDELAEVNARIEVPGDEIEVHLVGRRDVGPTSGYAFAKPASFGASTIAAANGETTRRTRPAGRSRCSAIWSSTDATSPSAGPRRPMSCSPASVGATLRVVRDKSRTPMRSSRPRIAWLSADRDTPTRFAARVKLRASATARKEQEHSNRRAAWGGGP